MCSRCKTLRDVDLATSRRPLPHVPDLAGRLACQKCKDAGEQPPTTLLQLTSRQRHSPRLLADNPSEIARPRPSSSHLDSPPADIALDRRSFYVLLLLPIYN